MKNFCWQRFQAACCFSEEPLQRHRRARGTLSHSKYVIGNAIVYRRCVSRVRRSGRLLENTARRRVISELPVPQRESNMRRGDVMLQMKNIKVQFIAGFGPIVPEAIASRK